jgi:hypothetical protein
MPFVAFGQSERRQDRPAGSRQVQNKKAAPLAWPCLFVRGEVSFLSVRCVATACFIFYVRLPRTTTGYHFSFAKVKAGGDFLSSVKSASCLDRWGFHDFFSPDQLFTGPSSPR